MTFRSFWGLNILPSNRNAITSSYASKLLSNSKFFWLAMCSAWIFGLAVGTGMVVLAYYNTHGTTYAKEEDLYRDVGVLRELDPSVFKRILKLRVKRLSSSSEPRPLGYVFYSKHAERRKYDSLDDSMRGVSLLKDGEGRQAESSDPSNIDVQSPDTGLSLDSLQFSADTRDAIKSSETNGFKFHSFMDYSDSDVDFPFSLEGAFSGVMLAYRIIFTDHTISGMSPPTFINRRINSESEFPVDVQVKLTSSTREGNTFLIKDESKSDKAETFEIQYHLDATLGKIQFTYDTKRIPAINGEASVTFSPLGSVMIIRARPVSNGNLEDPLSSSSPLIWSENLFTSKFSENATIPSQVSNLKASNLSDTRFTLTWSPSESNGAMIASYSASVQSSTGITEHDSIRASDTPSFTLSSLTPGTVYTMHVRAINRVGTGKSRSIVVTTLRCQAAPPINVRVHIPASDFTVVAWTHSPNMCGEPVAWQVVDHSGFVVCEAPLSQTYCELPSSEVGGTSLSVRTKSKVSVGAPSVAVFVPKPGSGKCTSLDTLIWTAPKDDSGYHGVYATDFQQELVSCGPTIIFKGVKNCVNNFFKGKKFEIGARSFERIDSECIDCFVSSSQCGLKNCKAKCWGEPCGKLCHDCVKDYCLTAFMTCTGFTEDNKWECIP